VTKEETAGPTIGHSSKKITTPHWNRQTWWSFVQTGTEIRRQKGERWGGGKKELSPLSKVPALLKTRQGALGKKRPVRDEYFHSLTQLSGGSPGGGAEKRGKYVVETPSTERIKNGKSRRLFDLTQEDFTRERPGGKENGFARKF